MHSYAAWLRGQATMLARVSKSAADAYRDIPIQASFMSLGAIRVLTTSASISGSVGQLQSLANRISREAAKVEQAQREWQQLKSRLEAEARAEAAAVAAAAQEPGT